MTDTRQQFETFIRMILKGQSDITYRAYNIEEMAEADNRIWCYKYAGLIPPGWDSQLSDCNMAALKIQRDLVTEGYGVVPFERVDQLVTCFWPYNRIKGHHRKGPKRHPEEVQRLYMQHLASLEEEYNASESETRLSS